MTSNWPTGFTDWNAQFFRELKGRCKPRTLLLTIAVSIAAQLLLLLCFMGMLPDRHTSSSEFCTGRGAYHYYDCIKDAMGNPIINWTAWWAAVFQAISWTLPAILMIAGVYMLIGDLAKEERRGTLNFIRLSPQASQNVLIGKILGVPAIPYVAVALVIPLHLWSALAGGIAAKFVVSIYLVAIAACTFVYTAALLYAFLGGNQSWVGAIVVWLSYSFLFQLFQSMSNWRDGTYLGLGQWFYLEIGRHLGLAVTFTLINLGVGTYWNWRALNRRFRNPVTTLISKRQSYIMTACIALLMVGFVARDVSEYYSPINDLGFLGFFSLIWFMVLIAALTPHRQTLLDWARYRHTQPALDQTRRRRSVVWDLVWGEKSPALVAIALNLLITATLFTIWIATWSDSIQQLKGIATLVLGSTFILICATIAQMILFAKSQRRAVWATGTVAGLTFAPPLMLSILSFTPNHVPIVWLFTAFAYAGLGYASATGAFFSFLGHLSFLSLLTLRFTRQLRKAGESESKALLAGSRSAKN